MRILTFADWYLPGYKSGGPVRSLANLVERLETQMEFRIVTRDRDFGDDRSYDGIVPGTWNRRGNIEVLYLKPEQLRPATIRKVIRESNADLLYLNSMFSRPFSIATLLMRRLGMLPDIPIVLAPRGELSIGCLAINPGRKRLYLGGTTAAGVYRDIVWQASSAFEEEDIRRYFGGRAQKVVIASDVPPIQNELTLPVVPSSKAVGRLRAIFVARISPVKNLELAIKSLRGVRGEVDFDIYGPMGDEEYWRSCVALLAQLPANARVSYKSEVAHSAVPALMQQYDVLYLPTRGENYGHAIHESMCAGRPVLISNRTPWRNLNERGVGWDVPLEDEGAFTQRLQQLIDMDRPEHQRMCDAARRFGLDWSRGDEPLRQNVELFYNAALPVEA